MKPEYIYLGVLGLVGLLGLARIIYAVEHGEWP